MVFDKHSRNFMVSLWAAAFITTTTAIWSKTSVEFECNATLEVLLCGSTRLSSKNSTTRLFKRDINNYEVNTVTGNTTHANDSSERRRLVSVSSSISGGTGTDESHSLPTSAMRRSSFRLKKNKFRQFFENMREFNRLVKDSNVFALADGISWDWEIVTTILRVVFTKKS